MDVVENMSSNSFESPAADSGVATIIAIIREYQVGRNGFSPAYERWWEDKIADFANQVDIAEKWLVLVKPDLATPSRNTYHSSYRIKHKVEEWTQKSGHQQYISNSAILVAAIRMGIKVRRQLANSQNGDVLILRKQRWPR
jgi:hypothetical protein